MYYITNWECEDCLIEFGTNGSKNDWEDTPYCPSCGSIKYVKYKPNGKEGGI